MIFATFEKPHFMVDFVSLSLAYLRHIFGIAASGKNMYFDDKITLSQKNKC